MSKSHHQLQQQQQIEKHPRKEGTQTKTENESKNGSQQLSSPEKKTSGSNSKEKKQQQQQQQRSPNKIYRTPPTPEPEVLHVKERSFILDSIAVNTTSSEYTKIRPRLGQVGLIYIGLLRNK